MLPVHRGIDVRSVERDAEEERRVQASSQGEQAAEGRAEDGAAERLGGCRAADDGGDVQALYDVEQHIDRDLRGGGYFYLTIGNRGKLWSCTTPRVDLI